MLKIGEYIAISKEDGTVYVYETVPSRVFGVNFRLITQGKVGDKKIEELLIVLKAIKESA